MKLASIKFIFLFLFCFALVNCNSKSNKTLNESPNSAELNNMNCDTCKFTKPFILKPEKTDLSFKVDISEKAYFQPFQYDLLHSYGILGRINKVEKDTLKDVSFSLLDVGECDRYKIVDVRWETMRAEDSVNYHHFILFNIEKGQPSAQERVYNWNPNVPIKKGEIIKINISSKSDPRINLPNTNSFGHSFAYIFPPFDCPIKIIDTSE